ncbi:hypothetical protein [Streptomyces sp. GbtcB6]|uniref:hypothetical protein n=1 Tax=Streptomyces sp. GbtcB6 TaxID=2824751 RepID=UPI001C3052AD|nr:hypothetical protein [Streptomyces sp. GbtcB6]
MPQDGRQPHAPPPPADAASRDRAGRRPRLLAGTGSECCVRLAHGRGRSPSELVPIGIAGTPRPDEDATACLIRLGTVPQAARGRRARPP